MGQVTVTINGRSYRLACGDGEEARVGELAAIVAQRLDRLVAEVGNASQDLLLLMVALLLADEVTERVAATADGTSPSTDIDADGARSGTAEPSARAKRAASRA